MYPVDLLKVSSASQDPQVLNGELGWALTRKFLQLLDPHANPEPLYWWLVHRFDERRLDNLPHRGLADTLEGCLKCDCWRWYVVFRVLGF